MFCHRYRIAKGSTCLSSLFIHSSLRSLLTSTLTAYFTAVSLSLFPFPIPLPMPSHILSHICTYRSHPFIPSSISSFSQCQPFCLPSLMSPPHPPIPPPLLSFCIHPSLIPFYSSILHLGLSFPFPPPLSFLLTRSPCHRAKPAYLHWNKSTSSHSHFSVVSFFSSAAILLATSPKN